MKNVPIYQIGRISSKQNNSSDHSICLPNRSTMDQTVNTSGITLLELCQRSPIKIVNGRLGDNATIGSFTLCIVFIQCVPFYTGFYYK